MKYEGFRKVSNYFNLMNREDHIFKDILEGSAALEYIAEMEASFKSDGPDVVAFYSKKIFQRLVNWCEENSFILFKQ